MRQKRILSVAAENPDASLAQIADEIATVTPDVVESVLESYGDPAESAAGGTQGGQTATSDGGSPNPETEPIAIDEAGGDAPASATAEPAGDAVSEESGDAVIETGKKESSSNSVESPPSLESLTPKQRETLVAIRDHPDATQRELAELLDVSAPTVSNRVNAVPGFEWDRRRRFVDHILEPESGSGAGSGSGSESGDGVTPEPTHAAAPETEAKSENDGNQEEDRNSENETADAAAVDTSEAHEPSESNVSADDAAPDATDETTEDQSDSEANTSGSESDTPEVRVQAHQLEDMIERLNRLSEQLEEREGESEDHDEGGAGENRLDDPELAHKVIHACVVSEEISEEEELEIIKQLV
jgi:hypothetical protein